MQRMCVGWFRLQYPAVGKLLFAVPNGGARSRTEAAIMKAEGVTAGVTDLILLLGRGGFNALCIEMKTTDRHSALSDAQIEWRSLAITNGSRHVVCRTLEEFDSSAVRRRDRASIWENQTTQNQSSTNKNRETMTTHNPKFRGTPGPWRVDGHEHKNGVVEYTIVSISGDAVGCAPVAEVLRNNPRPMPEQRIEANARLLAAAPDLLAVLESLVGIFEPHKLTPYWSMRETVNAAKKIIGYIYGVDERNRTTNESPSNDAEFLEWLYVRLVGTHGENPNTDYMQNLTSIIEKLR